MDDPRVADTLRTCVVVDYQNVHLVGTGSSRSVVTRTPTYGLSTPCCSPTNSYRFGTLFSDRALQQRR